LYLITSIAVFCLLGIRLLGIAFGATCESRRRRREGAAPGLKEDFMAAAASSSSQE